MANHFDHTFGHEIHHALGASGTPYNGLLGTKYENISEYLPSREHGTLLDYNNMNGRKILKNNKDIGEVRSHYLHDNSQLPHIYTIEELFNDFNDIGISLGTKAFSPLNGYRTNNALMKFENNEPYIKSFLGKYIDRGIPNFEDTFKRAITGRLFRRDGGRLVKKSCKNDLK